jgi:hypothetical protein
MKNIRYPEGNKSENIPTKEQKPFRKAENQVYFFILVSFHAPGSGSKSTFPKRIRIRDSHMNADPGRSGTTTLYKIHKISIPGLFPSTTVHYRTCSLVRSCTGIRHFFLESLLGDLVFITCSLVSRCSRRVHFFFQNPFRVISSSSSSSSRDFSLS